MTLSPSLLQPKARLRVIPGFPGYWVGDNGSVWSSVRFPRRLVARSGHGGYVHVRLTVNGKQFWINVHRLVAMRFLPPCPGPEYEVGHLDDDKTNNAASNLKWMTRRENTRLRTAHGRGTEGEKNGYALLTEAQVREIRRRYDAGARIWRDPDYAARRCDRAYLENRMNCDCGLAEALGPGLGE